METPACLRRFGLGLGILLTACSGGSHSDLPPPIVVAISAISPANPTRTVGTSTTFSATVTGSTDTAVNWSASAGFMNASMGDWTAPATAQSVTITAAAHADPTKTSTTTVTVAAASVVVISAISPANPTRTVGTATTFSATVTGSADTAVNWSATAGTMNAGTGDWTAPATAQTVTITAAAHADPTKTSTTTVTVNAVPVGSVVYVDGANNGSQDGSVAHPYATLTQAVAVAQSGYTIKVAQGTYAENLSVTTPLSIIGGFPGGGDYSASLPAAYPTRIQGSNTAPVVRYGTTNDGVTEGLLEGFTLSGGSQGVLSDGWVAIPGTLNIRDCIVENNGLDTVPYGGGLSLGVQNSEVIHCIIRNNRAGKGAGISTGKSICLIEDTLIENNTGSADHGGGVYVSAQATIRNSMIRGNVIGAGYGWGGGMIVDSTPDKSVLIEGCVLTDNSAPSYGSALFLDEGSNTTVRNCLIYKNRASEDGGALAVDGPGPTHASVENCTFADNLGVASSAVLMDTGTVVNLKNCILWGHTKDVYDRGMVDNTLTVSFSSTQYALAAPWSGTGNILGDPLFANAAGGDYHLKSTAGRWNGSAWVVDAEYSPCIDAGDPASAFALEPAPNGGRINLGCYGNTAQASKSR